jgi:5-methylthioadenosine/S-adenosylhomocysteine deaminase
VRRWILCSLVLASCREPDFYMPRDLSGGDDLSSSSSDLSSNDDLSAQRDLALRLPDLTGVDALPPPILTPGATDRFLIMGLLLTPTGPLDGELLVEGNLITCLATSCSAQPGAAGATVIQTFGLVMPGLIDAHNHGLFDMFDEGDWTPNCQSNCTATGFYKNHNQWTGEMRYGQMVDAKQYLNGEGTSPIDVGCEMDKYTEVKALVGATTSILMAPGATNRPCYQSLARTIDMSGNDLGSDKIQTSITVPPNTTAMSVCSNFASGSTNAYVVHVGEGVDTTAKNEFATLASRNNGCLLSQYTTIVHGTAFDATEFNQMAAAQMRMVWSPKSNVFLYGDTAKLDIALTSGVQVIALGPDWSLGGSVNLLDELAFAAAWDDSHYGNVLDDERLFRMVTSDAAKALGVDAALGSLEVGKRADLVLIAGDRAAPYASVVKLRPSGVQLVMVDGRVLYGDGALQAAGAPVPGCETLDVCGTSKFLCAAETSTANQLNQTFAQVVQVLTQTLTDYDNMVAVGGVAPFSPIAPLAKCP